MKKGKHHDMLVLQTARCFVENNFTMRDAAEYLGVSKSLVHKRLKEFVSKKVLLDEEKKLVQEVKTLIAINSKEKHMRGGLTTKEKYLKRKSKKSNLKEES